MWRDSGFMSEEGVPAWADERLTRELELMLAVGETQAVEYKERFPKQLSDLGNPSDGSAAEVRRRRSGGAPVQWP